MFESDDLVEFEVHENRKLLGSYNLSGTRSFVFRELSNAF